MRIYYLIENADSKHGGGRYAGDLVSAVKNAGYEVVVSEQKNKWFGGLILDAIKIRKHLKNCDIIHAIDGYPYAIVAAVANIGLNKKLIITVQGTYAVAPLYNFIAGTLVKWAYKRADKIIAISRYTKKEILKKVNVQNIEVVNHGIHFDKFYREPIESGDEFILSVGALKYRKGYHISIPSFAQAKKEFPDLKYKIIGSQKDANYFDELKNLATQLGVDRDIEFLSGLGDEALSELYRRARLFILTSVNEGHHFEGFGLVFLEAAAAGLSVVGTTGSGIEDAVKNNFNGILVPQNDIKAAAEALLKILKDEQLRREMSLNSFSWAKDHDWDKVILQYFRVYEDRNVRNRASNIL
ncbi:MAG: glycosyltransferase family 4 protein [Parcubacteria group bacterium]|nr:glycosyltransferase family 4 protein [Parcubacteria group bacterium]